MVRWATFRTLPSHVGQAGAIQGLPRVRPDDFLWRSPYMSNRLTAVCQRTVGGHATSYTARTRVPTRAVASVTAPAIPMRRAGPKTSASAPVTKINGNQLQLTSARRAPNTLAL